MVKRCLIIALMVLCACAPCKEVVSTSTSVVQRDSIYITHYDTIRVVERDTLRLMQLQQWHDRVMSRGKSTLANPYCTSTAEVLADGYLEHTLDTRREALLPVRLVEVERVVRDTIFINTSNEASTTEASVVIKRVNKPLSWWAKTQIITLWVLVVIIVVKHRKTIIRAFSGWRI